MCIYARDVEDLIEVKKDEIDLSMFLDEEGIEPGAGRLSWFLDNQLSSPSRWSPESQNFRSSLPDFLVFLEEYLFLRLTPTITPKDATDYADLIGRVYYFWNYWTFDKGKARKFSRNHMEWFYWSKRNQSLGKFCMNHMKRDKSGVGRLSWL
jgi:hypothetical protein